jgi:hypothetical protein
MYNIAEQIQSLALHIQKLSRKDLERYIIGTVSTTAIILFAIIYYTYTTSSELVIRIDGVKNLGQKSAVLMQKYEKIQEEEIRLENLLEKYKDFNIKIYFEQFCKEQGLMPDPNWDTSVEVVKEKFEEVTLAAAFKGQTTQKLVKILEALEKNEIIYIKMLDIKTEKNSKTISFDITLATKRMIGGEK